MSVLKKILIRTILLLIVVIPIAGFAHSIFYPQETRSILVDFSDYKRSGRIYAHPQTPQSKIDSLQMLIEEASVRVTVFWGQKISNPKFIFCESEEDYLKYSGSYLAPAVAHLKLGAHIVLAKDGLDLDVIAHEISHAELYERTGFYKKLFRIPTWFDEGLAMQVDHREYYSYNNLLLLSDSLKNIPDIKAINYQFQAGGREQVMLNYMAAKHELSNWYSKEKLDKFIAAIKSGKSFEEAYEQ